MNLKLRDGQQMALPGEKPQAVNVLADLFRNQGRMLDEGTRVDWRDVYEYLSPRNTDAVATSEIRPLLQSAMEVLIREPLEPLSVITGLFSRVEAEGLQTQVLAGALGAVTAGDIPENGTYPEVMFQIGGAMQTAFVGKSGIAASFTDEALRYSTWDIMAMNLRLMKAALLRHKEQKAASFLRQLGTELYNNASPSSSLFGVTTGRGLDMAANGSLSIDDLFKAMAHMSEEGFAPSVMLVNPLFFYQFLQDPVLRGMMMAHGGGAYFQNWNGNAGPRDPWASGPMGGIGPSAGNKVTPFGAANGESATGIAGREHGMTATPSIPGYFPWPFQVVASPLVPFDSESNLGDIILCSQGDVGYHIVDEELTQVEWRNESVDVTSVKLRERYAFAVAHEGQGVGVMKNVKLARNYWDGTINVTDTGIAAIGATDSVL